MFIDISRPITSGMVVYPGNPGVKINTVRSASEGLTGLSEITLGSHTGTHIDTLLHIDPSGSGTEVYPLDQYIGDAEVVEIASGITSISAQDIPPTSSQRILLKTKNSYADIDVFDPDFVALTEDGAKELLRRNIVLVGIDGPSIKKKGVADAVHELFLRNNIVVVEGLLLAEAISGQYTLMCLPLPISTIDGVPVRAVLSYAN